MKASHLRDRPSTTAQLVAFFGLIAGYLVLGLGGIELQSAQIGVSPVWPASGLAFAIAYWFGLVQVLALLPSMLMLAWILGLPPEVAALSAFGGMLEVAIPVFLLRRLRIDPRLAHLRDVLLFVVFATLLGPAIGATVGSTVFAVVAESPVGFVNLWLLWWLGDSIGMLIVGGAGLVAVARGRLPAKGRRLIEIVTACIVVAAITLTAMSQVTMITSPLVFYLLIPVFLFVAQRGDQYLVILLGCCAMAAMLLFGAVQPTGFLSQPGLGFLYLDVALLWVVVFTGMVTSSARQEMRTREQASWLAMHDPLTRLLNRHALMERLEDLLQRDASGGHVLMYMDLDRFKDLNDAEGHRAGDHVLRHVGVMLGEELRASDSLARMGGDEFAAVLRDCRLLDACSIAENIRAAIERYEYMGERGHHRVEVSIGLLELAARHQSPEDALHEVDTACYEAKRAGRNRVWVYAAEDSGDPEPLVPGS